MNEEHSTAKPFRRAYRAYIEITNVCNLNGSFCPGTRRAPRFLDAGEFALLAHAVKPYTDYVCLHLMGSRSCIPRSGVFSSFAGKRACGPTSPPTGYSWRL